MKKRKLIKKISSTAKSYLPKIKNNGGRPI
jgi:hypothetical protein